MLVSCGRDLRLDAENDAISIVVNSTRVVRSFETRLGMARGGSWRHSLAVFERLVTRNRQRKDGNLYNSINAWIDAKVAIQKIVSVLDVGDL